MVCLSTCPRCRRMVTLPEGADAATMVRCPLCCAEFPLSEAMALVPPALIVVPPGAQLSSPTTAATTSAELVTEPFFFDGPTIAPPADSEDETPAEALEAPEFSTSPVARQEPRPPETDAAKFASAETSCAAPAEDFVLDFEEHLAQAEPHAAEGEEVEEVPDLVLDTGDYALAAEKPSEPDLQKTSAPETPKVPPRAQPLLKPLPQRRKPKKKSILRLAFGWVFGGCLSVVLAYYGIWWIRGESAGLPRFDWLPGLPSEGYGAPPLSPQVQAAVNANLKKQFDGNGEKQTTAPMTNPSENQEATTNPPATAEQASSNLPPPAVESGEIPIPGVDNGTTPPANAAKPAPLPKIGPRPPANYTFLDFDNALQEVTDAYFKTGKMNAENYPAFCRLAQVRTYIAPEKLTAPQQKSVQDLLGNIAKDPEQVAEIGRLAGEALKNAGEHPGGIMLAGKAKTILARDGMFGAVIKLAGGSETVSVLSAKPFGFQMDDDVLILGGMVAKPAENIGGFKGKSLLVTWFGESVFVPAAK